MFLGEPQKWVPVAVGRIAAVVEEAGGLIVSVTGDPKEKIVLAFASVDARGAGSVYGVSCTLSLSGTTTARFTGTGNKPSCT